ncbi:MAG: alpha/beta hydrolase-fold protein, partial [Bacteroides sp.]|nr:alpha/beta hydrolase-fold protein [Bacteroides sp.]
MNTRIIIVSLLILGFNSSLQAQTGAFSITASLTISEELQSDFKPEGRLFLFLCEDPRAEPRTQTWPMPWVNNHIFAINLSGVNPDNELILDQSMDWIKTTEWDLGGVPEGEYNLQVLWDQDSDESGINAPGNLFSLKQKVEVDKSLKLEISLDQVIEATTVAEHSQVRLVDIKSDTLSSWWGKPMHLKASVLLPEGYDETKAYPIRYNVAGYGGRYTRVNRLSGDEEFMKWWNSEDAPRLISVFLDGEGPFGDSYQMDSENSGPYGYSLINELIPHIESMYRGSDNPDTRFVDGCSTGGWVSLGLQLYYPDFFGGCFSYSPDAVEFENYQLLNIYQEENAFVTSFGLERPVMRNVNGEPLILFRKFLKYENVI